jgi:hypothetical protein
MRTSVSLSISVLVVFFLSLLVSGCGVGPSPRAQDSSDGLRSVFRSWTTRRVQGYESAVEYRGGDLPAYKIVIQLSLLSENGRNEFLEGFQTAYMDANETQKGKEYATILRQALQGGFYDEAVIQGRKYVSGAITDVRIQELISGSVGLSRSSGLGWKAGYIVGFAQEMARQGAGFEEAFYQQAETKYNALRGALGV